MTANDDAPAGAEIIRLARAEGADPREIYERRARVFEEEIAIVRLRLACESLPVTDGELARVIESIDRARLAWHGQDGRRAGARREYVLRVLAALGRHLAAAEAPEPALEPAFEAWLDEQAYDGDDGPFLDITVGLLAHRDLVLEAARAWVALDAGQVRGRHSGATALYAALRALFKTLPEPMGELSDEALRKTVRRLKSLMDNRCP